MGTLYTNAVGNPPVITSRAWKTWYQRLLAFRLAECPLARATTYYFAQSGNDSTGDGSLGNPWKTVAKANTVIAASSGNIACLFNRGDLWKETSGGVPVGLTITKSSVTIGSYGTGSAKPIISAFAAAYNATWTTAATRGDNFNRTFSRAETNTVVAVRELNDTAVLYRKCTSIAECDNVPGSWYWASNVLYLHPIYDRNPTSDGRSYEALYSNTGADGILIGDGVANPDGVRIDSMRVDGFGAGTAATARYGIHGNIWDTSCAVISNCEAYYGGKHNIGQTAASSGGIWTVAWCSAGFTTDDTVYVTYAANGGHESICHECECIGGLLAPAVGTSNVSASQPYRKGAQGGAYVSHTINNALYKHSLDISYGCKTVAGIFQANAGWGGCQAPPTWTDLKDCRAWVVDDVFRSRDQMPTDLNLQPVALTTASQGTNTVVITSPPSLSFQQPAAGMSVVLSGGSSQPETLIVSSYSAGTITFTTNIVGSSRTTATYAWGCAATSSGCVVGGQNAANTYVVSVNGHYEIKWVWIRPDMQTFATVETTLLGTYINCTFLLDASKAGTNVTNASRTIGFWNSGSSLVGSWYNCRLHMRVPMFYKGAVDLMAAGFNGGPTATPIVFQNSILSNEFHGGGGLTPGIGNVAGNQINNAYVGATTKSGIAGYDQDPYYVEMPGQHLPLFHQPDPNGPLASSHQQPILGYRLEYDALWNPRSTTKPCIGPLEPLPSASTTWPSFGRFS